MKTYTNNSPGMRGITVNSDNGPYTHYLDAGASVDLDPKLVIAVPDLGPDKVQTAPSADDALAAENAELKKQVGELTKERDALKAENTDLKKAQTPDADLIKAAVDGLDPKNDKHWTNAGLPEVAAVKEALGADVTRAQIEAAAPDAKRPA